MFRPLREWSATQGAARAGHNKAVKPFALSAFDNIYWRIIPRSFVEGAKGKLNRKDFPAGLSRIFGALQPARVMFPA
jgi:hypothetical protein